MATAAKSQKAGSERGDGARAGKRKRAKVDAENIPASLKSRPHWLVWRYEHQRKSNGGKPLKVPYYTDGGRRTGPLGGERDLQRLADFETAVACARMNRYSGIGIAVLASQDITVLDLDNCLGDDGNYSEFAQEVIRSGSYVERSPSGRGLRAVYKGAICPNERRNFRISNGERVELYCGGGFATLTGHAVSDPENGSALRPREVRPMPRQMQRHLVQAMRPAAAERRAGSNSTSTESLLSINAAPVPNLTLPQALEVLRMLPHRWGAPGEGTWYRVAAALHMQFDGREEAYRVLDEWSSGIDGYDEEANRRRWDAGFAHERGRDDLTTMRNLIFEATDNGYMPERGCMEAWGLAKKWGNPPALRTDLACTWAHKVEMDDFATNELVEGILSRGPSVGIVYGTRNAGKTFFVIDMACAIARGLDAWLGHKVESGFVLYLATEAPTSVLRRLYAYQKHHECEVRNFLVVKSPINLFDDTAATEQITQLVQDQERRLGLKCELIVGDTLARLAARANENSNDMAVVMENAERIAAACVSTFLIIAHPGKDQSRGIRGWSGTGAAIDTEIELSVSEGVRTATITKQRDGGVGDRVSFRLETVDIGLRNKWGKPVTSCIVVATDALPALERREGAKRRSIIAAAIIDALAEAATHKADLVKQLPQHGRSGIYRALQKLVSQDKVNESPDGYLSLASD